MKKSHVLYQRQVYQPKKLDNPHPNQLIVEAEKLCAVANKKKCAEVELTSPKKLDNPHPDQLIVQAEKIMCSSK